MKDAMSSNVSVSFLCVVVVTLLAAASACDSNQCTLPGCYCAKAGTPGGLSTPDIPQMVLLMFDGAVNDRNLPYYNDIFTEIHQNPNGCPIGGTAFVSHNFTDYSAVRKIYLKGVEIGVRSVTSRTPPDWWKNANIDQMKYEILQQRENIQQGAEIDVNEIVGWRSPGLQSSGSSQYRVLQLNGFEYDSTVVSSGWSGNDSISGWPFTLDHPYPERCQIRPCPSEPYPGLWEIPVVPMADIAGQYPCTYLGGCGQNPPKTKADVLSYLRKNFEANYKNSRAPVYFNLRPAWLMEHTYKRDGFLEFIKEIVAKDDVYLITAHQLLAWMRKPQTLIQAKEFAEWSCPNFVNNEIGIWDHIKNFFNNKVDKSPTPEEPVTQRPRPVNQIYFVGSSGLRKEISMFTIGVILSLAKLFS